MKTLTLEMSHIEITGRLCSRSCTEPLTVTIAPDDEIKDFSGFCYQSQIEKFLSLQPASKHHEKGDPLTVGNLKVYEIYKYNETQEIRKEVGILSSFMLNEGALCR